MSLGFDWRGHTGLTPVRRGSTAAGRAWQYAFEPPRFRYPSETDSVVPTVLDCLSKPALPVSVFLSLTLSFPPLLLLRFIRFLLLFCRLRSSCSFSSRSFSQCACFLLKELARLLLRG
jgi:hypothetical protein